MARREFSLLRRWIDKSLPIWIFVQIELFKEKSVGAKSIETFLKIFPESYYRIDDLRACPDSGASNYELVLSQFSRNCRANSWYVPQS